MVCVLARGIAGNVNLYLLQVNRGVDWSAGDEFEEGTEQIA